MTTGQLETKTKIQKYKNTGGAEAVRQLVHINCQYWNSLKRVRYADHHFDWFKCQRTAASATEQEEFHSFPKSLSKQERAVIKKRYFHGQADRKG